MIRQAALVVGVATQLALLAAGAVWLMLNIALGCGQALGMCWLMPWVG
jgi:hypothetical protein